MSNERILALFLQVSGVAMLLALPAVVMPFGGMAAVNDWFGLAALPDVPMVEYLARSASALYAVLGALCLYLAREVRYYRDLLGFFAGVHLLFGALVLAIDIGVGMPTLWTAIEGPFEIVWSLVLLGLVRRL